MPKFPRWFEQSIETSLKDYPDAIELLRKPDIQTHRLSHLVSEDGSINSDLASNFQLHLEWVIRSREQLSHVRRRVESLHTEAVASIDIIGDEAVDWTARRNQCRERIRGYSQRLQHWTDVRASLQDGRRLSCEGEYIAELIGYELSEKDSDKTPSELDRLHLELLMAAVKNEANISPGWMTEVSLTQWLLQLAEARDTRMILAPDALLPWREVARRMVDYHYEPAYKAERSDQAENEKITRFFDSITETLLDAKTNLEAQLAALLQFQQRCERTSSLPERSVEQAPPPPLKNEERDRLRDEAIEYFWTAADIIREREWWTFTALTECKENPNRAFFDVVAERCALNRSATLQAQTPYRVFQNAGWSDPHDRIASILSKITTIAGSLNS